MIDRRLALAGAVLATLALAGCSDSGDQPETATALAESAVLPAATMVTTGATLPAQVAAVPPPAAPTLADAPATTPAAIAQPAPAPVAPEPAAVAAVLAGATPAPERTLDERMAAANPAEGEVYLMQCGICHSIEEDGPAGIGPGLFDVVGALVGRDPLFTYSPAIAAVRADGATWTPERLDAFLAAPGAAIPGTRMGFGGFTDPDTRADVIAWLATLVPSTATGNEEPAAPQIIGVAVPGLNPVSFVAVQADVGADQYVNLGCGTCHGADMRGGVAPALLGPGFAERWFVRPLSDLLGALRTMPPNDPGTLPDARYLELTAAILAANGFVPGSGPLRASPATLAATGFYQPAPPPERRNR